MGRSGETSFYDEPSHVSSTAHHSLMEEWLQRAGNVVEVQRGDVLEGTIVSISPTEILVDIGCKSDGVVSGRELERMTPEEIAEFCVGDCIPVYVIQPEDRDGNVLLSISRARAQRDWRRAQELYQSGEVFRGQVSDCNKGGVIVNVGRLRGFVPASQLSPEMYQGADADRDDDNRWRHLLGEELTVKVIEIDRNRNRLILSERAATREHRQAAKQKLLEELQVGETRRGVITSICEFGAFVDLGGADGLIHLSELSWSRVEDPSEIVRVGQEVEVYVLDVDRERQRIGLSLRRLTPEPWEEVVDTLAVGQIVEGTITKIVNFGAFARIGEHVEGLIHISELAEERVNHAHEVVKEGDRVRLKIIRIDSERRRIGLSRKQAIDDVDFDWREELDESMTEEGPAE